MAKKETSFVYNLFKDCKHVRRYQAEDEKAPIRDVYVSKEFCAGKERIKLTIEAE